MKARVEGPQDLADPLVFAEFLGPFDSMTDMEVEVEIEPGGIHVFHVECADVGDGHRDFAYPFDIDDVYSWVYHFEIDREVRYEIFDAIGPLLEQALDFEQVDPVLSFVRTLLTEWRWIELEGRDLLVLDPTGEPLTFPAVFTWDTPTVGSVTRPFQPTMQPTVAKLRTDGTVELTWLSADASSAGTPKAAQRTELIDLTSGDLDEALVLYDDAHAVAHAAERASVSRESLKP